jgi:hypothetical protein
MERRVSDDLSCTTVPRTLPFGLTQPSSSAAPLLPGRCQLICSRPFLNDYSPVTTKTSSREAAWARETAWAGDWLKPLPGPFLQRFGASPQLLLRAYMTPCHGGERIEVSLRKMRSTLAGFSYKSARAACCRVQISRSFGTTAVLTVAGPTLRITDTTPPPLERSPGVLGRLWRPTQPMLSLEVGLRSLYRCSTVLHHFTTVIAACMHPDSNLDGAGIRHNTSFGLHRCCFLEWAKFRQSGRYVLWMFNGLKVIASL